MSEKIESMCDYCLNCPIKPCSKNGCPLNNNIPEFIKKVKEGNIKEAYNITLETTVLQSICGRVCPHKKQCEGNCVRRKVGESVHIGNIERYIGDYSIEKKFDIPKYNIQYSGKVAIVGGGPAGLTCAAFLARKGIDVTIYERKKFLGGLLMYGIPAFRLSKNIVKDVIKKILDLNIKVEYNKEIGKNLKIKELIEKNDYIVLTFGANVPIKMGIEGENLNGVYGANELLEYGNHPNYTGKTVIINGGGNVAIDIARTVKRLGAERVLIVYRRGLAEMPAEENERENAIKEGIEIFFNNNILKINGEKNVESIELIKTQLKKVDGENRPVAINIENSNYNLKADYVIMALGSKTDSFVSNLGLEITNKNYIKIDENYQTSNPKIFAGGDLAGGEKTVAWAARAGRDIAEIIIKKYKNNYL